MRVELPFAAPYDIEITRVRAMGDDKFIDKSVSDESATPQRRWAAHGKAKANGNAEELEAEPRAVARRDEFADQSAKLCEAKRRKAIEDAAGEVEVEAKVEQEIKADAKTTDETKQEQARG